MKNIIKFILQRKRELGILALVLLCYCNVYDMDFVYDDEFYIQKNKFLDSLSYIKEILTTNSTAGSGFKDSFFRPIQFFSYMIVSQVFGKNREAFHALNVFLHLLNALLLFLFFKKINLKPNTAFLMSALWAVHPLHTEVVAYISGTADPLQGFFTLSALVVYLSFEDRRKWLFVPLACCALLSKEVAIVFPGLLAATIFIQKKNRWKVSSYKNCFIILAVFIIYLIARRTLFNFNGDFEFYKTANIYTENIVYRVWTFLATVPNYIKIFFYPINLHIDRAFPVFTNFLNTEVILGASIALLGVFNLILGWKKQTTYFVASIGASLWIASAHSLHSGILVPMNSFFLEHWMYVPSMGAMIFLGQLTDRLKSETIRKQILVIGIMVVAILGTLTFQQNRVWESPVTLYEHILKFNPKVTRVRHNLAMAYSELGDQDKAKNEYLNLLQLNEDHYPQTYHNLALIYLRENNFEKAEELLLKAIDKNKQFYPSYDYLIEIYKFQKKSEKLKEWQAKRAELNSLF